MKGIDSMASQITFLLRFRQLLSRYLFVVLAVLLITVINSCNDSPVSSTKNTAPVWSVKDTLVSISIDSTFSLKLSTICSDEQNDPITFTIKSIFPSDDTIIGDVYKMASKNCTADTFTVAIEASDYSGLLSTLLVRFVIRMQPIILSQDTLKMWLLNGPPKEFVLIDVRGGSEQDFIAYPYLIGNSKCKPYNLKWPEVFQQYCTSFSKSQHIVIHCKSGTRAGAAATHLASLGYRHVYNAGGIMTWTSDTTLHLPLSDTLQIKNIPQPSMRKTY